MAASKNYTDFIKELFAGFGEISVRKMFGGAGVYCDGAIFAIIGDDDLWLKADDKTRTSFEAAGYEPFTVEMKGKTASMSYYAAPEEIFDDEEALREWGGLAMAAARRADAVRATKKKTKKSIKRR